MTFTDSLRAWLGSLGAEPAQPAEPTSDEATDHTKPPVRRPVFDPWPPPFPYGEPYMPDPPLGEKSPLVVPKGCRACGGRRWWRVRGQTGLWTCVRCHPPSPALQVDFEDHTETSRSQGGQT
jgi:hypothetical protein